MDQSFIIVNNLKTGIAVLLYVSSAELQIPYVKNGLIQAKTRQKNSRINSDLC